MKNALTDKSNKKFMKSKFFFFARFIITSLATSFTMAGRYNESEDRNTSAKQTIECILKSTRLKVVVRFIFLCNKAFIMKYFAIIADGVDMKFASGISANSKCYDGVIK